MREMRVINFVTRLIDEKRITDGSLRRMLIHSIAADDEMTKLTQLAQSEFELASRFVAAPESNQGLGWLGRADLGV
jgi:NTE family protein